ncbi:MULTISPECIES: chaplin [Streptomyces]|uniref:Chaplin domain-containing protein n=1 Tax=Streptomyces lasiicapitis TaxID=1923961 RepID=A0ABQ2MCU1_9ACTN|nr:MULTISPECIES: chaplin [Streptomyces]QIB46598.1 chaplin [Streptomyces aureoverticillatus]GGO49626.1 hypothetical protein GCM10012286_48000 [Streptomyces lasiicapitis]
MNIAKKAALAVAVAGLAAGASAGAASATDAHADGSAKKSPGIGSGNLVQAPVHVPVNVTGNSVNVVGILNPALANDSVNR